MTLDTDIIKAHRYNKSVSYQNHEKSHSEQGDARRHTDRTETRSQDSMDRKRIGKGQDIAVKSILVPAS